MKKVLFCAYESLPFIKTGGLADVAYGLPKSIKKYEVSVVMPLHKLIKDKYKLTFIKTINIDFASSIDEANLYCLDNEGVTYYFIDSDKYFNREDVYGYDDDALRFAFFSIAVIMFMIALKKYPNIIHSNDYHTALIPVLCKYKYNDDKHINKIKHVFTIHNLMYQGHFDKSLVRILGIDYKYFSNGTIRFNDEFNLLKAGICAADKVTTVSSTYAKEILDPFYGQGLEKVLQYHKDKLLGITNGIDYDLFNPSKDKYLYKKYGVNSYLKGKVFNKQKLSEDLGLKPHDEMLIGIISRMTYQKGFDILLNSLEQMLKKNIRLVVIGSGESKYEYFFRLLEKEHKDKVRYFCVYDESLAHKVYAACDLMIMPSLFEPCGLSQMIAMRYGTLPLVRETGGLKETVEPYNEYEKTGRGFSFGPYNALDLMIVFNYAYRQYFENPKDYKMLIRNAMSYDSSFVNAAKKYEKLYDEVLKNVKKV